MASLQTHIREAVNRHCEENRSNTPDFILTEFMTKCLAALHEAIQERDRWYGIAPQPGQPYRKQGEPSALATVGKKDAP